MPSEPATTPQDDNQARESRVLLNKAFPRLHLIEDPTNRMQLLSEQLQELHDHVCDDPECIRFQAALREEVRRLQQLNIN